MACLLQLPHDTGYQRAEKLSTMIPEYDSWTDRDPLCIRLQMALRAQNYDKALQITADLGTCSSVFLNSLHLRHKYFI